MKKKNFSNYYHVYCLFLLVSCGGSKTAEKAASGPKDTLVFAQISECKTLDPQDTTEQYSQRIIKCTL